MNLVSTRTGYEANPCFIPFVCPYQPSSTRGSVRRCHQLVAPAPATNWWSQHLALDARCCCLAEALLPGLTGWLLQRAGLLLHCKPQQNAPHQPIKVLISTLLCEGWPPIFFPKLFFFLVNPPRLVPESLPWASPQKQSLGGSEVRHFS